MSILRACFVILLSTLLSNVSLAKTLNGVISDEDYSPSIMHRDGQIMGLIPQTTELLFQLSNEYSMAFSAQPWRRAQSMVEHGQADFFVTYPSAARQEYAVFSKAPIYLEDYGYLIFKKGHTNAEQMRNAKSFEDLKGLVFLSISGSGWEEDAVPKFIERIYVGNGDAQLNVAFKRNTADFFIMNLAELAYRAKDLGFLETYDYQKVDFIPDSQIPFHLGISSKNTDAEAIIAHFDELMATAEFRQQQQDLLQRYQQGME